MEVKSMTTLQTRREFIRKLQLSTAALPFLSGLPSLSSAQTNRRKQRMVIMFSPNGVAKPNFWPTEGGEEDFVLPESLKPLEPFRNQCTLLQGLSDKIRGDGDSHMRGIGCLLTGIELFPGNVQGGGETPAGWASGISIDQEITNFLQADPATHTRFGSLEFGVMVPDVADTWTRLSYAGPNRPLTPINDPYRMFKKLYGRVEDQESLKSVLDDLAHELRALRNAVPAEDRQILEEHTEFVRDMERNLEADARRKQDYAVPRLEPDIDNTNDNMPEITKMQIELLVNSFAADFARTATLQFTKSVGGAQMRWLGIEEDHHGISHKPDEDQTAQEQITCINKWYCEQLAYLAKRLAETPEPGGQGSLLDSTLLIWTNELGKGNSHSLDDIPFVLVGGGLDFSMGRHKKYNNIPHNRFLLSLAHGFGHRIERFGNPDYCGDGPLNLA
jgi:hypothetical protein